MPQDVRLNSTHFFIMILPNKRELQMFSLNHASDIDFIKNAPKNHTLFWLMIQHYHQMIL